MLEYVSVEQAVRLIEDDISPVAETEQVPLAASLGRILAEAAIAGFDNPPFDRSPIDGYACRAADLAGASRERPVYLDVVEEVCAGQSPCRAVEAGQAARIMTGAPVPEGCDCCVFQEDTDYGDARVAVYAPVNAWGNYCFRGEDFKKGARLLEKGTKIGYVEAGILSSMGMNTVLVRRLPRLALLATGDEVVRPGELLLPGKIYDSNQMLLAMRLRELGVEPVLIRAVPDDGEALAEAIREAAGISDLIVTTGGVSVGKKDMVHRALELLHARKVFWRVLLKPGMPTVFSVACGTPVISLSGNPFGAAANFELLVRPALARLTGDQTLQPTRGTGVMADAFPKASAGRRFVRASWRDGRVYLPQGLHSSGVLASMRGCNCLVDIPAGTKELRAGDAVEVVFIHPVLG